MPADVGTGLGVTWNSSTFAMEILGAGWDGEEVPIIDTTHMLTTTARTKMAGDLREEGTFDVECHLSPTASASLRAGSTGTVVIEVPYSTNGKITGGLIVQRVNYTFPLEDKMICGLTMAWAGAAAWSATT